eukprot:466187-Pyramimonas_sp.AAC.1
MEHNGIYVDFARQRVTEETLDLLEALAEKVNLKEKIASMFGGKHLNSTEDRAVLHAALRAPADEVRPRPSVVRGSAPRQHGGPRRAARRPPRPCGWPRARLRP